MEYSKIIDKLNGLPTWAKVGLAIAIPTIIAAPIYIAMKKRKLDNNVNNKLETELKKQE